MNYIGDFPEDFTTVTVLFTTHDSAGAPVAPSSAFEAADVKIYKNGSATEKATTNGLTMTSPFDTITGLHCLVIDTSNDTGDSGFWTTGATYSVVLSPDETVDSQAVAKVIATFGICLAPALRPTTAGRTLDVSSGGEAGIDLANVGSPTTTLNLSGTTIKTATDVETDTADIQSRLPAALVSGRMDSSVGAMATDVITNTSLASSAVAEIQSGLSTLDAAGVRTAIGLASADLDTQLDGLPTAVEVATEVWGTVLSTDGTASDIILVNLDAPVSSRLASGDYTEPDNASIAAIKAKTDNLPSDPADASVIAGRFDTLDASVSTVDTNVDAIKAKTDSLTFTVAGQVDSNIQSVNDVTVTGTGAAGNEWGP